MVKLTPELINQCMQYINPCRDRELDLRGRAILAQFEFCHGFNFTFSHCLVGYKIPEVQNFGATLDQFDTIDFSDNDLRKLGGFPYLQRIKCILLNNNRIA